MAKKTPAADTRKAMPDLQWMETPEEKAQTAKASGQQSPDLAALQAQIAKLSQDLDTQRSTNMALLTQPIIETPAAAPQLDMTKLPDPTIDPEAYASEVARRTTAYIGQVDQQRQRGAQQAQTKNSRVEALWDDFGSKYEAYAGDPEKVEYAATKVAQRAQKRGMDVDKYVFGASSVFMADVAAEMDKLWGKPEEADDLPDEEDNRTAGIFGGQESGGKPAKGEEARSAFQPNSMFGDVQAWQAKTGFTR